MAYSPIHAPLAHPYGPCGGPKGTRRRKRRRNRAVFIARRNYRGRTSGVIVRDLVRAVAASGIAGGHRLELDPATGRSRSPSDRPGDARRKRLAGASSLSSHSPAQVARWNAAQPIRRCRLPLDINDTLTKLGASWRATHPLPDLNGPERYAGLSLLPALQCAAGRAGLVSIRPVLFDFVGRFLAREHALRCLFRT